MNTDPTNPADRQALIERLENLINKHQAGQKKFALLLIKLNHFRQFNITHGYPAGDRLLIEFCRRLRAIAREHDFVARMGSSDFAMVFPEILNEGHATLAAIKLLSSLDESFEMDGGAINISASIGIVIFPDHASELDDLLRKAETSLIAAQNDIQSYSIYQETTKTSGLNRWDIESGLDKAIEKSQFDLYFQPQVYLDDGRLYGAEALIRWQNDDQGFIRPDIFIPIAEQSGHIYDITKWTINAALWLMKEWPQTSTPLKAAVNISTKMLAEPGLVETVQNALGIYGIPYEQLTLEITESALVEDLSASFKSLEELQSLGVNISIDDFGTGYSSLAYFKNIPANELKIDQSFVSYMLENQMDQHIVKTVIKMAQGFDLKVVAEGIEDRETFLALKSLGCDIAQGYYLAKPMPQQEFIQWLQDYDGAEVSSLEKAV
jgi:diguanylate cyclase (GGDEF)-like protein